MKSLEQIDQELARLFKSRSFQQRAREFQWSVEGVRYANLALSITISCLMVIQVKNETLNLDGSLTGYIAAIILGIIGYDSDRRHSIFDGPIDETPST